MHPLLARLAGPALLLAYGLLRWADAHDGDLGGEPWSTAGRLTMSGALVALVALVAGVRRVARHRTAVTVALALAVTGGLGTILVRADDLSTAGGLAIDPWAAMLVAGVVGAMVALATARQVSWLEPGLALAGFAALVADLDLAPLGAALLGGALAKAPEGEPRRGQPV